ncbi:MAG TPA: hypothetical protein VGP21_05235 [Opitutaceae bacterium]|nr:hypothetical protein [Opitutaceae bacterium]
MLLDALTPDKKDTMAALLAQGFQEISILSKRGKLKEAKSLASALAPILVSVQDPGFDLESTTSYFARHHQGYPPVKGRTNWCRIWTGFVSEIKHGRTSVAA